LPFLIYNVIIALKKDWERFQQVVEKNGDQTQKELAEIWGNISQQASLLGIKKAGLYPQKKLIATKSGVKNREDCSMKN